VCENRVLRRKLHNEELRDLYCSPSIIRIIKSRRMRWAGHVSRMGEKRNAYRLLVGKPEGKRPLGRPRRMWVDNIKMNLGGVKWGDVDWIGLAKDRNRWRAVVNSVTVKNAVFWAVASCGFVRTDVWDERVSSIYRLEKLASKEMC
jgi:hypothetical protein